LSTAGSQGQQENSLSELLRTNQEVVGESSGLKCKVERFLGGGGQGEVYRANVSNRPVALKWYFKHAATAEQRAGLATLVERGTPNDRFLWPMEIVSAAGVPGFGYLMPLREPRFKSLFDLMKRTIEPGFRALFTAAIELPNSFYQLHAKGLCYCDISFGNVFFDPLTGDILICDNDNVVVDGSEAGIRGTPDFMAPEVVRGEKSPSIATDRFSLAVLLFYLLHTAHPLYGRKVMKIHSLDLPARTRLCGDEPVFIFDPHDKSNEAVSRREDKLGEAGANALACWPVYPQFVRDTFLSAFTTGIRDADHGRVVETVWRSVMARARDSIVYCSNANCGVENFFDETQAPCWSCGRDYRLPPRIRIDRHVIALNFDSKLYPHHVAGRPSYDFTAPVAEVTQHPSRPGVWGLTNVSETKWVCTFSDGTIRDVEPMRSVPLSAGVKVNFGKVEGDIRV
jgi:DNA-binding helix-hairpin-helix protein with protein kinase domain